MNLKNDFRILFIILFMVGFISRAFTQVSINEYSCSNKSFNDNYGRSSDWIELYNSSLIPVDISGYHLSNKATTVLKWAFPAGTTIPANGFLKIWASGKNNVSGGNYHTNFKLLQTLPDKIIFSDAVGVILDSLTLKPAQVNHSRGRTVDGGTTWGVFLTPTPGTSNTTPFQEYASRPAVSIAPGFYGSTIAVAITSPDAFVTIHYTLDGKTPTTSSPTFTTTLSISTTTILRARAFSSNALIPASFIKSASYFIGVTHTVPTVSIFSDTVAALMGGTQFSPETSFQYFGKTGSTWVLKAETDGAANEHGNDSWSYSQRGIDFISDDELGYNYAINTKLFVNKSRKSFHRIILKAAANDSYPFSTGGAHIRDSYCNTLSQRGNLHLDERTWSPAVLYVNGQYWGVYDIREKVDDDDFTGYYYNQGDEDSLQFLQTWGGTWSAYGGAQAQTDWNSIKTYITTNDMSVAANYHYVDSVFNIKSFVDYFLLNSWAVTSDWLNWNTSWWRGLRPDHGATKWRYTLWDMDATFGHYINYTGIPSQLPTADPCAPEALPDPGGQGHTLILDSLLNNPDFKQYYETRYIDLMNSIFSCDVAIPLLDSMIAVIAPEMPRQITKWGGSLSAWQANVDTLRNFILQRCTAIQIGLDSCYGLSGPYPITLDVQAPGSGTVQINSFTPDSYPYTGLYYGNISTSFIATPKPNYLFDHWEFDNNNPSPDILADSVAVTFAGSDNIIAVFRYYTEPQGGIVAGVPSAFSPNGDNNNDLLYVLGSVEQLDFQVFNRWGQQVWTTKDRSKGWDGTFDGKPLNPGVFAYHLTGVMPNGDLVNAKGNITLVR